MLPVGGDTSSTPSDRGVPEPVTPFAVLLRDEGVGPPSTSQLRRADQRLAALGGDLAAVADRDAREHRGGGLLGWWGLGLGPATALLLGAVLAAASRCSPMMCGSVADVRAGVGPR